MTTVTAAKAKIHFSETLAKAQQEPVQITRNGKPIAFIISVEDFQMTEEMKRRYLVEQISLGQEDIKANRLIEGKKVFARLFKK